MGLPANEIKSPEQRWAELRTIGEPPPLPPALFLVNRDAACEKLREVFSKATAQLKLETRYSHQIADFVAAFIADMDEDARVDAMGRCLVISGVDGWNTIASISEPHVLVADFALEDFDSSSARLLEKALRAGHSVILGGMPGGIPSPNRIAIPNPKDYQVKDILEKAGYREERARILAQKCDGNLNVLLRSLQRLPTTPEWTQRPDAADLVIAVLLGGWNEAYEADKAIVERIAGKPYVEWIEQMRHIALCPDTPIVQRGGSWRVIARYEGWYGLGPRVFDDHLSRLMESAVSVMSEVDPKFDLPRDERFAALAYGKSRRFSRLLRTGLAESLALLGSHSRAFQSCSSGKAEMVVTLTVREILGKADWLRWGSLNDVLPLLAEAAPDEFLDAVENALSREPSPFTTLFAEEGDGLTGDNYMTGILWSLETLAWEPTHLTRVVVLLGELAAKDPGGNWGNRPSRSLSTILLPWLPQTRASVASRKIAVATLACDFPEVAWKLLVSLLHVRQQISMRSRRPAWRESITDDWSEGVTSREYSDQATAYVDLAIAAAEGNASKLAELIHCLGDLPSAARDPVLDRLRSDNTTSMTEADRFLLWSELTTLVTKHRKYSGAGWALPAEAVESIASIAETLTPASASYRHQRLFAKRELELYEESGRFEEQQKLLEDRRQTAVDEVFADGGVDSVLEFATSVESPSRLGMSFGSRVVDGADTVILPALLECETKSLTQFAGGFVFARFRAGGWQWVDKMNTDMWTRSQKGLFMAHLPFEKNTWERVTRLLGDDQHEYWSRTEANPHECVTELGDAVYQLLKYGRPIAAVHCLERLVLSRQPLDSEQAIQVLESVLRSPEDAQSLDLYCIKDVMKTLQDQPGVNSDKLMGLEWAYLPALGRCQGFVPRTLERRLADDPAFFCEVIQAVFRSSKVEFRTEGHTENRASVAENAWRLLSEWKTPPGGTDAKPFDPEALCRWLNHVKDLCEETGHLEVALSRVGHVLVYVPADPCGLWLHHSAARELNAKDAGEMREGFTAELFNSRGIFEASGGREEGELAVGYRRKANELEFSGYHRLANSLRALANSYEREAERQAVANED